MATRLPSPPVLSAPAREQHHLVRERLFGTTDVSLIVAALHDSRSTGTLLIDLSQGSVNSIRFSERHKVTFNDNATPTSET